MHNRRKYFVSIAEKKSVTTSVKSQDLGAIFCKIGQYDILVQEVKKGSSPSDNVYCKSQSNLHENLCAKVCLQ